MKSASHEIRSLMQIQSCRIPGICFPLMAFIDYRGFRLTAVSILPLNSSSLIYGSSDAGNTVHTDDPAFNALMEQIGGRLNLKGHLVGPESSPSEVFGPCDIEGHKGSDGRYYLLDFSRLAPPSPPTTPGSHLYNLLRMELVRSSPMPLCSDAFTSFARIGYKAHNAEVREIWAMLLNVIIPHFASEIDALDASSSAEESFLATSVLRDGKALLTEIHRRGINCRLIGRLRSLLTRNGEARKFLLQEMIVRTAKSHLGTLWRAKMTETGIPSEEPTLSITIFFFNLLVGQHPASPQYWEAHMVPSLLAKFPDALSEDEIASPSSLITLHGLSIDRIVLAVCRRMGIELSKPLLEDLTAKPDHVMFALPDLIRLESHVSHLNIIDYAQGMACLYEAVERTSCTSAEDYNPAFLSTQNRLLTMAEQCLKSSSSAISDSHQAMLDLANCQRLLGTTSKGASFCQSYFATAVQMIEQTLLQILSQPKTPYNNDLCFQCRRLLIKTRLSQIKWAAAQEHRNRELFPPLVAAIRELLAQFPQDLSQDLAFQLRALAARVVNYHLYLALHRLCPAALDVLEMPQLQGLYEAAPGDDPSLPARFPQVQAKLDFRQMLAHLFRFCLEKHFTWMTHALSIFAGRFADNRGRIERLAAKFNLADPVHLHALAIFGQEVPDVQRLVQRAQVLKKLRVELYSPDHALSFVTFETLHTLMRWAEPTLESVQFFALPPDLLRAAFLQVAHYPLLKEVTIDGVASLAPLALDHEQNQAVVSAMASRLERIHLRNIQEPIAGQIFLACGEGDAPLASLTHLEISHSTIHPSTLSHFLAHCPALVLLDLTASPISDATLLSLRDACPQLQYLCLRESPDLTLEGFQGWIAASAPSMLGISVERTALALDPNQIFSLRSSAAMPQLEYFVSPESLLAIYQFPQSPGSLSLTQTGFRLGGARFQLSNGFTLVNLRSDVSGTEFAMTIVPDMLHQRYAYPFTEDLSSDRYILKGRWQRTGISSVCNITAANQTSIVSVRLLEAQRQIFSGAFELFGVNFRANWHRSTGAWQLNINDDQTGARIQTQIWWPNTIHATVHHTGSRVNATLAYFLLFCLLSFHYPI